MAKIPSRGTILKTDIATVLTAVAQLNSINVNGIEVETFDGSTLDQTLPGKIMCPTGYVESGEIAIGGFMDPTGMAWLTDLIDDPIGTIGANAAGGIPAEITFADSGSTAWSFVIAGVSLDFSIEMSDGVKFSSTLTLTNLPTGW